MLETGMKAPDISLSDQNGVPTRILNENGEKTLLFFYRSDTDNESLREALAFSEMGERLKERRVRVIGVGPDTAESHKKMDESFSLGYTLLSDIEKTAAVSYAGSIPGDYQSCLIDEYGFVIKSWQKPSPDLAARKALEFLDK